MLSNSKEMNGHGKCSKTIQSMALIHLGGTLQPWRSSWGTEYVHLSATFLQSVLETLGDSQHLWFRRGSEGETLLRKNQARQGSVRKTRVAPSPEFSPFCCRYGADSLFLVISGEQWEKAKNKVPSGLAIQCDNV